MGHDTVLRIVYQLVRFFRCALGHISRQRSILLLLLRFRRCGTIVWILLYEKVLKQYIHLAANLLRSLTIRKRMLMLSYFLKLFWVFIEVNRILCNKLLSTTQDVNVGHRLIKAMQVSNMLLCSIV